MKKLIALVLALMLVLSASSAFALTVGFSQIGQESDWRTANTDNVCNAIEEQGWTLVYSDGQQKQENQVQALRRLHHPGRGLHPLHRRCDHRLGRGPQRGQRG